MNGAAPLGEGVDRAGTYQLIPDLEHSCTRVLSSRPSRSDCAGGCARRLLPDL